VGRERVSFDAAEVMGQLREKHLAEALDLRVVELIDSTHAHLLRSLANAQRFEALIAHQQSDGRGRQGRSWHTAPHASLALSIRTRLNTPISALSGLSVAVGVALREALLALGADQRLKLKWPNDLLVDGAKLGGILIEFADARSSPALVVSAGVNIALPDDLLLDQPITDLKRSFPKVDWSGARLAAATLDALLALFAEIDSGDWRRWLGRFDLADGLRGQVVHPRGVARAGIASGIDLEGRLLLDVDGEVLALSSAQWA